MSIEEMQKEADLAWERVRAAERRLDEFKDEWTNWIVKVSKAKQHNEMEAEVERRLAERGAK